MTSLKKISIITLAVLVLSLSLSAFALSPALAAKATVAPAKVSFSLLATKFKRAANRFGFLLLGAKPAAKAGAPKQTVAAVAKGADGQPAPAATGLMSRAFAGR